MAFFVLFLFRSFAEMIEQINYEERDGHWKWIHTFLIFVAVDSVDYEIAKYLTVKHCSSDQISMEYL